VSFQSTSVACRDKGDFINRFVAYLRVSTEKQGEQGHGINAQRQAIQNYLAARNGELLVENVEVEIREQLNAGYSLNATADLPFFLLYHNDLRDETGRPGPGVATSSP
jgi:hypothetical protein